MLQGVQPSDLWDSTLRCPKEGCLILMEERAHDIFLFSSHIWVALLLQVGQELEECDNHGEEVDILDNSDLESLHVQEKVHGFA